MWPMILLMSRLPLMARDSVVIITDRIAMVMSVCLSEHHQLTLQQIKISQ